MTTDTSTQRIGILGAGQLGRMLALAGYPLGLRFRLMDTSPDAPAGQMAELITGSYEDALTLAHFADGLSVATYEFENVPVQSVKTLAERVAVYPPPKALEVSQDRLVEKTFFNQLSIPTPRFMKVDTRQDLELALSQIGCPAVLKTRRMGYDGKGQAVLRRPEDVPSAWQTVGGSALILEQFIAFQREVSILSVRGITGQTAFYPLVENHHHDGILRLSIPTNAKSYLSEGASLQNLAQDYATRVLEALNYVGVLAIEFFEVDGKLVANEMAPRVHNSGHWTIEGAQTSQFENHLRAIAGLPLGTTELRGYSAMLNLIGTAPEPRDVLAIPGAHLHLYGKAPRPGRKLGHITVCAASESERDAAIALLRPLAGYL
jgi:5-(carboxyamino)imidazole ribonucleotide synthase